MSTPLFAASAVLLSTVRVGGRGANTERLWICQFSRAEPGLGWGAGRCAASVTVGLALPWRTEIGKPGWEITVQFLPLIQFCVDNQDVESLRG